jgi:hypothetical protein
VSEVTLAERLARAFHETYERLAPDYDYKTREASAVAWEDVPKENRELMIATTTAIMADMRDLIRGYVGEWVTPYVAALGEVHEYHCGCDQPGNPSLCVATPVSEFAILREPPF